MWVLTADRSARRGLGFGALITLAVFGAAALTHATGHPVIALILAGVVLCVLPVLAATLFVRTGPLAGYTCACGIFAASWLAYTSSTIAWRIIPLIFLLGPAIGLIAIYPAIMRRQDRAAQAARRAALDAEAARQRGKWPDLLAGIGHRDVEYAREEPTAAGYRVHLRLPRSGKVTYQMLTAATERLEIAARLRRGSLRFERGDQAHQVILQVAERDLLAATIPLPPGGGPMSVNGPVPLGIYQDGQNCAVTLREIATLIVGLRGSGKSNLLNVLLAQLARCPDVLIFAIDLKGGRMAAPWIQPWLERRAAKPVIDWLATDRAEAEIMLRALLRAVDARARSCSGGEKITPSARQPAVILVCDEVAVILGLGTGGPRFGDGEASNATLAGLATRLVMTGRSEAIDLVMATQRGTVTMMGSADLKSQCALRIGLGVSSEADARLIIPDNVRIAADLAGLRHPGSGIVQQGRHGRVLPVKFYRLDHDAIGPIAERCGELRPEPDQVLAEALGYDYFTRWARFHARNLPRMPVAVAGGTVVRSAVVTGTGPGRELTAGPAEAGPVDAGPAEAEAAEAEAAEAEAAEAEAAEAGPVAEPGEAVEPAAGSGGPDPAGRSVMVALLRSAGVKGMTVRGIAERLSADGQDVADETIRQWLIEEAGAGRAEQASYGRWKWQPPTGADAA